MASAVAAQLVMLVNEKFVELLKTLNPTQLQALAHGRLVLSLTEPSNLHAEATKPAASKRAATVSQRTAAPRTKPKANLPGPDQIASHLRRLQSVEEGEAYLAEFGRPLTMGVLQMVGSELGITLTGKKDDMIRRLLAHVLGARSKYAALRAG